jgi:hypothetical protein
MKGTLVVYVTQAKKGYLALDRAVDAAYGVKGFATEAERVDFLFSAISS